MNENLDKYNSITTGFSINIAFRTGQPQIIAANLYKPVALNIKSTTYGLVCS